MLRRERVLLRRRRGVLQRPRGAQHAQQQSARARLDSESGGDPVSYFGAMTFEEAEAALSPGRLNIPFVRQTSMSDCSGEEYVKR